MCRSNANDASLKPFLKPNLGCSLENPHKNLVIREDIRTFAVLKVRSPEGVPHFTLMKDRLKKRLKI